MNRSKDKQVYKLDLGDKIILMDNSKFKLLKYIDEYGSITKASQKAEIPYRSSLNYIKNMENELDTELVTTKRGGKGGGGQSKLTDMGKLILKEYKKVESILKMHTDVNEIEGNISEIDKEKKIINIYLNEKKVVLPLRENLTVGDKVLVLISPEDIFVMLKPQESSVRNVFGGLITGMELKNQMIRLNIDIGKITLFVDITEYSREELNLNLGKKVFLGFKAAATAVIKL